MTHPCKSTLRACFVLMPLLLATSSGCTTYEIARPVVDEQPYKYVKKTTTFLFFTVGTDWMRCTETASAETYCVTLDFKATDQTPCFDNHCAQGPTALVEDPMHMAPPKKVTVPPVTEQPRPSSGPVNGEVELRRGARTSRPMLTALVNDNVTVHLKNKAINKGRIAGLNGGVQLDTGGGNILLINPSDIEFLEESE